MCHLDKADCGKGSSENDKEGNCLSDRGMLHLLTSIMTSTRMRTRMMTRTRTRMTARLRMTDEDEDDRLTRRMYLRKSHSSSLFSNRCRLKIREKTAWWRTHTVIKCFMEVSFYFFLNLMNISMLPGDAHMQSSNIRHFMEVFFWMFLNSMNISAWWRTHAVIK